MKKNKLSKQKEILQGNNIRLVFVFIIYIYMAWKFIAEFHQLYERDVERYVHAKFNAPLLH